MNFGDALNAIHGGLSAPLSERLDPETARELEELKAGLR